MNPLATRTKEAAALIMFRDVPNVRITVRMYQEGKIRMNKGEGEGMSEFDAVVGCVANHAGEGTRWKEWREPVRAAYRTVCGEASPA